jgi:hypothetical protein
MSKYFEGLLQIFERKLKEKEDVKIIFVFKRTIFNIFNILLIEKKSIFLLNEKSAALFLISIVSPLDVKYPQFKNSRFKSRNKRTFYNNISSFYLPQPGDLNTWVCYSFIAFFN